MKTNSNTYTLVYSAVLVVIVAFLLAFVYQLLKPRQDANVALDTEKQILYSLNIRDISDAVADAKYKEVVKQTQRIGDDSLFVCRVNDSTKYVIPLKGTGLWGGISGYIAINDDKNTVYGAYFNHESETAGLGAEIKDNRKWQENFIGKKLFREGSHEIDLSVKKNVDDPATQVNAVTGATITSNGVSNMLHDCLSKYVQFLNDK